MNTILRLFPRQELSFRALILTLFIAWFVGALIGYAAHGNIINFIKWVLGQG
jgi:hypothetical protein